MIVPTSDVLLKIYEPSQEEASLIKKKLHQKSEESLMILSSVEEALEYVSESYQKFWWAPFVGPDKEELEEAEKRFTEAKRVNEINQQMLSITTHHFSHVVKLDFKTKDLNRKIWKHLKKKDPEGSIARPLWNRFSQTWMGMSPWEGAYTKEELEKAHILVPMTKEEAELFIDFSNLYKPITL